MNMKVLKTAASLGILLHILLSSCTTEGQQSRIGLYPGNPNENFAPALIQDNAYRNIALHRAAYHSSAYDYNLTAQLVTDGIIPKETEPVRLTATTHTGMLPKREREWAIDGGEYTRNILSGDRVALRYGWHGGMRLKADHILVVCTVAYEPDQYAGGFLFNITGSNGVSLGQTKGTELPGEPSWHIAHTDPNKMAEGSTLPTRRVNALISLENMPAEGTDTLEVCLQMKGAVQWTVTELKFFNQELPVTDILPSAGFSSAWMSAGKEEEWVYVDLGAPDAQFDEIRLHWLDKALAGRVEVSDDALNWKTIGDLPGGEEPTDVVRCKGEGRYVRVLMQKAARNHYTLAEIEVWGKGGLIPTVSEDKLATEGKRYLLNGGGWKLQRASEITATGEQITAPEFDDKEWITATVPATVLMSYANIGAIPEPNYDNNLFQISESFFNSNFWYRRTFTCPEQLEGKHVFLNFDGINWKANVFLNGKRISRIEGAFMRGRTDVTGALREGENVLAVEIIKNAHPGAIKEKYMQDTDFNGGLLGLDNPTFHATIGWDWISTIRGRNIGIWNDVYLSTSGAVSLSDPFVESTLNLPDTLATLTPHIMVANHESAPVEGLLRGWVGNIRFEQPVRLEAGEEREIVFNPDQFNTLKKVRMPLWWPNGYGSPVLHESGFDFVAKDGEVSDSICFLTGIRQMNYKDIDSQLKLYINGRRFVPLGGNWGFSENNLCYRGREYDIAVDYHRQMNFNMIRNWVGQTGDEEFYEACDRHGIMVWQDFWLANPADGPDPMDEQMFLRNAYDYVRRIRNHPSIGLYCGRNEGYPPAAIDQGLRHYVSTLHGGIAYISSSADEGVSGHGPYWALPAKEYFGKQTGKLHSERGMPNVMTYEGLCRALRPEHLWPQGNEWGQHDYCMQGAQRGASFNEIIQNSFGPVNDAQTFTTLAQWVNYEGYRAMYESGSADRLGLLIWMSHACWPSMTWQCYDYYFEPTAAFFGCMKACEPIHIQWNELSGRVEVVNRSAGYKPSLTARYQVADLLGHTLWQDSLALSIREDSTVIGQQVQIPDTLQGVCVIRLQLYDQKKALLSENTYVHSTLANDDRKQLLRLPYAALQTQEETSGTQTTLRIKNTSDTPAFMIRLNLKANDGEQVLPVSYSDNYFHLMPKEEKTVTVEWKAEDTRGLPVHIDISGLNIKN